MSVIDANFRTITCNGTGCTNTVTYEMKNAEQIAKENVWLRNLRIVQAQGRNFSYCSSICELSGIDAGLHDAPEEKKIVEIPGAGSAADAIKAAAAQARALEEGTRRMKSGEGGQVQISQ